MSHIIPTVNKRIITLQGFECKRDNLNIFIEKLRLIDKFHDEDWTLSSDDDSDDDDDSEYGYHSNVKVLPESNSIHQPVFVFKNVTTLSKQKQLDESYTREKDLRRIMLYKFGKYELEEGELLDLGNGKYIE